jgi:hypothetical protein
MRQERMRAGLEGDKEDEVAVVPEGDTEEGGGGEEGSIGQNASTPKLRVVPGNKRLKVVVLVGDGRRCGPRRRSVRGGQHRGAFVGVR